jgi:hypothetical protein
MNSERVLASEMVHAEEVVHPLVGQHGLQQLGLDAAVLPPTVPLVFGD